MTYAGARTIYDADSHLMELPDFLSAHASKKIKDRLPNLQEILTGQFDPDSHAGKQGHNPENVDKLLALGDGLTKGPKWHDASCKIDIDYPKNNYSNYLSFWLE